MGCRVTLRVSYFTDAIISYFQIWTISLFLLFIPIFLDEAHALEIAALIVKSGQELDGAIERLQDSHLQQLKIERENVIRPLEKQLKQAHTDGIEQIGYLESCIAELKVDKVEKN